MYMFVYCPEEYNLFAQALETHRKMRASRAFANMLEESANNFVFKLHKTKSEQFKNKINKS